MEVNKITMGYVIQTFDTKTKKCIAQSFIAGDQVEWENEDRETISAKWDLYYPFDMIQPITKKRRR